MSRVIAHTLTIAPDKDGEDFVWSYECPYAGSWTDERPCGTWLECHHPVSDEQRERMEGEERTPCAESESGWHELMNGSVHKPTRLCWVGQCFSSVDVVLDIFESHGFGTYAVVLGTSDYEEIELTPIAELPGVSA